MNEYISRDKVLSYVYATHSTGGFKTEDDYLWFQEAVVDAATANVQPVSVIKELQEHIKQRILETAFNNGGIYGEVAEDIADRIDIWVDEFRRNKNA